VTQQQHRAGAAAAVAVAAAAIQYKLYNSALSILTVEYLMESLKSNRIVQKVQKEYI
jgi:hypothetical protein